MLDLPSALELEMLSDNELSDKISKLLNAISETKSMSDSYSHQLYRILQEEHERRKGKIISDNLSVDPSV